MLKIFKYPVVDATTKNGVRTALIHVPRDSRFLTMQLQGSEQQAWFLVDDALETEPIEFLVFGTGHDVPLPLTHNPHLLSHHSLTYVGTYQEPPFVWHVFMRIAA